MSEQIEKKLEDIETMEELNEYMKDMPDYITPNDIIFAKERIFSIETSKKLRINNGGINNILSKLRNKILIDLNTN
jgi:hypothetical protein